MATPSLEDQVRRKCKHFNGIMNKTCKCGIVYESVMDNSVDAPRPHIPCINPALTNCDKRELPTEEEVTQKIQDIAENGAITLKMLSKAKFTWAKSKQDQGEFDCPCGGGKAQYARASSNGHFWVKCKVCGRSVME